MINLSELKAKTENIITLYHQAPEDKKFMRGLLYSNSPDTSSLIKSDDTSVLKLFPYLFATVLLKANLTGEIKQAYTLRKQQVEKTIYFDIYTNIERSRVSHPSIYSEITNEIQKNVLPYYKGSFRVEMSREISFLPLDLRLFIYIQLLDNEQETITYFHLLDRLMLTAAKMNRIELAQLILLYSGLLKLEQGLLKTDNAEQWMQSKMNFLKNALKQRSSILTKRGFNPNRFIDEYNHSIQSFSKLNEVHDHRFVFIALELWKIYYQEIPSTEHTYSLLKQYLNTGDTRVLLALNLENTEEFVNTYMVYTEGNEDISSEFAEQISRHRENYIKAYISSINHLKEIQEPNAAEDTSEEMTIPPAGKNKPCPCGSGKKYKNCCLNKAEAAEYHDFNFYTTSSEQLHFIQIFEQATNGNSIAKIKLFNYYKEGRTVKRNFEEALKWLESAAIDGIWDAQHTLGILYKNGSAHVEKDYSRAVHWLELASSNKDSKPISKSILGVMYREGLGTKKDVQKAITLFNEASDNHALTNLAYLYQHGEGVEKNWAKAVEYYTQAADNGDNNAQYNLAICYLEGLGCTKNIETAIHYLSRAAYQKKDKEAMLLLNKLLDER